MKKKSWLLIPLWIVLFVILFVPETMAFVSPKTLENNKVAIVVSANASKQENMAARQFEHLLHSIYPTFQFFVTSEPNGSQRRIRIGLANGVFEGEPFVKEIPPEGDGFLIRSVSDNEVILASKTPKGLFNAVYSISEKLGCGFYLSYDGVPKPLRELVFKEWDMVDSPLQSERIVFDWHNFLSGCTGWDYEDWCSWIDQSAKMRYNTIMIHAYGNNPMFSFEYNGIKKEVGYLTTSISGRDWGAQHIKDIRRLPGGDIFKDPVFGSKAALVPDHLRAESATKLMAKVFEHAGEMAMKINFAIDVDTWSANPQNIIQSLPPECRIRIAKYDIVNPDTDQGYQYYKAQLKSLLNSYPQITTITVWVRAESTVWRDIKVADFPDSWQTEWKKLIQKYPDIEKDKFGPSTFAISKIVVAYQKALKEINREDVNIANGSWRWDFLPTASVVMPEKCTLIALDYNISFDTEESRKVLEMVGSKRKLIPVVWAHHDDHRYLGKPYTPYPDFNKLLKERNAAGFGIIHWTTRPLDLYFKSLVDQVWSSTENKKLETTISEYCEKVFGSKQRALQDYMSEWILHGPMFGRETSVHLFDLGKQTAGKNSEPFDVSLELIQKRINLLKKVDQLQLSDFGRKMFLYNSSMENFYHELFQNQDKFVKAYAMLERNSLDSARVILRTVHPEKAIELFAGSSSILPITKGEKAMIISMGTRWMPDFINLKQRARMVDVNYKFETTQHDSLAQYPGTGTYFIGKDKTLWLCLGEKELKAGRTGAFPGKEAQLIPENSRTYLQVGAPFSVPLVTIGRNKLSPGKYKLEIQYVKADPTSPDCKLSLVSKNSRTSLNNLTVKTDSKLCKLSTNIEIREAESLQLEIDPGKDAKQFTNLIISPFKL